VLGSTNFDVIGMDGDTAVSVTNHGLDTLLRISSEATGIAKNCELLSLLGVTLYANVTKVSSNAVIMNFKLVTRNSTTVVVDLVVSADCLLNRNDAAPMENFGYGFIIIGDPYAVTFLGKGAPLVDDVTIYWFGHLRDMEASLWTQVAEQYRFEGDSAFAFTWQNISFTAISTVSKSAILQFRLPSVTRLTLMVSVPAGIGTDLSGAPILVTATVTSSTEKAVRVLMVVDDDSSVFWWVASEQQPGIEFGIQPSDYGVTSGFHKFGFYAVDAVGTVSEEVLLTIGWTATPTKTSLLVTAPAKTSALGTSCR
jgi:hypothetical protein